VTQQRSFTSDALPCLTTPIGTGNVSEACRVFGVYRTRHYEWKNMADRYRREALVPQGRRKTAMPEATPTHVVEALLTLAVLRLYRRHGVQVRAILTGQRSRIHRRRLRAGPGGKGPAPHMDRGPFPQPQCGERAVPGHHAPRVLHRRHFSSIRHLRPKQTPGSSPTTTARATKATSCVDALLI
jgi:hypothetical protein